MTLSIVTATIGRADVIAQFVDTTLRNCDTGHDVTVFSNGATSQENDQILDLLARFVGDTTMGLSAVESHVLSPSAPRGWIGFWPKPEAEPQGTSKAFNHAIQHARGDVVVVLQSDLLILQKGWDTYLQQFFDDHPEAGVVGFAGGKRLGDPNLYRIPYELHQLARGDVYTSLDEWHMHGRQTVEPTTVAVLDGIAMAMRKSDWEAWGGYDERWFHHLYDIDLSLTALYSGKKNYVVPILCKHLNGQSVTTQAYADKVAPWGGDGAVHSRGHAVFYEKWRGRIPITVP